MSKVAIIGAGTYGTALGGILAENGHDIDYYDPEKEKERLKDVVAEAKVVLISAPSEIVMKLLCHLPKSAFIIVASKGFLTTKPFEMFDDWAVLSGAGFADGIKAKKRVNLTATDQRITELFCCNSVRFDCTDDRRGVLMCGALKNVYAIRAGQLDLKPNTKKKEVFIYEAAKEMAEILHLNEAKASTLKLACGMKDLILTCGTNSRNYQFGQTVSKGLNKEPKMTVEGLSALKRIRHGEIEIPENAKILHSIIEESTQWV